MNLEATNQRSSFVAFLPLQVTGSCMDTRAVGTCASPCLCLDEMLEWIFHAAVTHLSVTGFRDLALPYPVLLFTSFSLPFKPFLYSCSLSKS